MGSELYCPECRQFSTRVISRVAFPDGVNTDERVLVVRVEPEQSALRDIEVINSNPLEKIHVELDLTNYLAGPVDNQKDIKYFGRMTGYIHHCEGNRHWVSVTKGQTSGGGSGCKLYRYFLSDDLNAGNPQDLACTSDKRWPHPDYLFYLVHKETTKEAYNEYNTESNNEAHKDAKIEAHKDANIEAFKDANTASLPPSVAKSIPSYQQKESYNEYGKPSNIKEHNHAKKEIVQPSIAESTPNIQDTIKHSNAVYFLRAGDKIKFKTYLHPVTVATITEIGPSLWINDDRYTVYTDKPLIPFGDTIYNSDFSIVESKFNDAPPKGKWLNVDDVILVEGKLVNSKSKLEISCEEITRNTPEGRCMDALAKACEEARKSLAPLPSDSSTQSSGMSHQAEIAEKRNDFIAVGSDDSLYQETDHRRKQIGSIGYKFEK